MNTQTNNIIIVAATLLLSSTLMSGNAAAASTSCVKTVTAEGSSAGGIARLRNRRAKRRAERKWEKEVKEEYGAKYADIDDAKIISEKFGLNSKGNTTYRVKASVNICK